MRIRVPSRRAYCSWHIPGEFPHPSGQRTPSFVKKAPILTPLPHEWGAPVILLQSIGYHGFLLLSKLRRK